MSDDRGERYSDGGFDHYAALRYPDPERIRAINAEWEELERRGNPQG